MTMEGKFQRHYKHAILPASAPTGPRINFTFRTIVCKKQPQDAAVMSARPVPEVPQGKGKPTKGKGPDFDSAGDVGHGKC